MTSPTHSTKSHKSPSHAAHPEGAVVAAAPAAPATPTADAHLVSPAPAAAAFAGSFPTPPPIASIPATPAGFLAAAAGQFRGVIPLQAEQTALEAALQDLGKIPNYALFVGAPPLAQLTQLLTLASQWTAMRNASAKWDGYSSTQEGNVWASARPLMDEFRSAFAQAQKADPTLASQLPGLVTFLGVRSAVAQKAASTKRANKNAVAKGERPTHGKVGKARQRAAEKAALAAVDTKGASAPATSAPVAESAQANGATHS